MNLRKREILDNFADKHADAKSAIQRWVDIVKKLSGSLMWNSRHVFLLLIMLETEDMYLILKEIAID